MPPDPLPQPKETAHDLDELLRRLQGHVRRLRKRHARVSSDLVDFDQLLSALKQMRKHCAKHGPSQEAQRLVAAFIAFISDDDLR